jgi:hypothetical protein
LASVPVFFIQNAVLPQRKLSLSSPSVRRTGREVLERLGSDREHRPVLFSEGVALGQPRHQGRSVRSCCARRPLIREPSPTSITRRYFGCTLALLRRVLRRSASPPEANPDLRLSALDRSVRVIEEGRHDGGMAIHGQYIGVVQPPSVPAPRRIVTASRGSRRHPADGRRSRTGGSTGCPRTVR